MEAISIDEYGEQLKRQGRPVHKSGGIWWLSHGPGYCKPAFEFQRLRIGAARPAPLKSFVGYSHQITSSEGATRAVDFMVLGRQTLEGFRLEGLRPERRTRTRKGLRCCMVSEVIDLEAVLGDAYEINVSQSERLASTGNEGWTRSFYERRRQEWERTMLGQFGLKGWSWLGAWAGERLIAYMLTIHVEGVLIVSAVKSHSEALSSCPNDALYFNALSAARDRGDVTMVVNGGPIRPSLDAYKEDWGFRRTSIPYYTRSKGLYRLARSVWDWKEARRRSFETRQAASSARA